MIQFYIKRLFLVLGIICRVYVLDSQCYTPTVYCTAISSAVSGGYNWGLTNVTIGSINNTTSPNATGANLYQNYSSMSAVSTAGSNISSSITVNFPGSVRVFVDWNNDGVFNTSGSELCYTNTAVSSGTPTSFTIAVPAGQGAGSYRVRVGADYQGQTVQPCGPLVYPVEYEDYTILIASGSVDAVATRILTSTSLAASPTSNSMSFTIQNVSNTTITSVDAGYTVNGGTAVTQTFTGLSIAAGASQTLTFSSGYITSTLGYYSLRFFISGLNGGSSTPSPLNDTICQTSTLLCTGAMSGIYTIDSSAALSATNFPSFSIATVALRSCGVGGPTTLNVMAGTYVDTLYLSAITGVSAINTITFDGGAGNKSSRIITYPTTSTIPSVVKLQNTRYVTIKNLTIRSTSTSNGDIVHFSNDSNDRVNNCTVEFSTSVTSNTCYAILVSGADRNTSCNTCQNIIIDSNLINNGAAGVYLNVSPSTFTNYVLSNTINNSSSWGVYSQGNAALKVRNNVISLLLSGSSKSGIFINGTTTPSSPRFHDFSGNKIYNVTYSGMHLVYIQTSASNRTLVSNNFITGFNPLSGQGYKGIRLNNCSYMSIFHNSINCNASPLNTNGDVTAALHSENISTNNDVRNNHFVCTAPSGTLFPVYVPSSTVFSALDYNNYFNSNSDDLLAIGATVLKKNNFKTATPFNGGANSISENPSFISSSDLHVTNPCLIGVSGTGVNTDIDGQTRSANPHMGADEVLSSPTNDIGIQLITTPNFPLSVGSNTVTVVVKNYGSNTITSATVNYKLNSGSVVSESWSGSLAPCASTSFTFSTPVNVSTGSNTFICYTSAPNSNLDNVLSNDTVRWTLCNALSGSYTIGSGGNFPTINSAVSSLACGGLAGPVTFNILPGTYDEYINIPNIRGSSATNTILIQPSNGLDSSVIIKPSTYQSSGYVVQLNGVDYLTFNKIAVVVSVSSYYMHGIRFGNGSNFITISNCMVHHSNPTTGIYNDGISHTNTNDMNVTITGNRIYNGQRAVTCYSFTPRQSNINISNNTCINQTGYGIYFAYGDTSKVNNNTVISDATDFQYGIKFDANPAGGEMKNNRVILTNANRTSLSYGIMTYNFNFQSSGVRGLIANNIVSIAGTGNYRAFALEASTPYTDFYHNTAQIQSTNSSSMAFWSGTSSSTSNFRNNVFQNNGTGVAIETSSGSAIFNYNNFFSNGSNQARHNGSAYSSLSSYQTATSQNANSMNKKILFTSITNPTTTSPCINGAGMNLTSTVPADINNVTRSTAPDLGATEFTPLTLDGGVSRIISPVSSIANGATGTVTVTAINNGVNPITSLTLNYIIGSSTASQTFSVGSGIPVGGILPCDTLDLTFSTTFTMSSQRRLSVFISAVNGVTDGSQTNDSIASKLCTSNSTSSISQTICSGSSYFFKGANLTAAGTYRDTLSNTIGCDSIVTLTLSVISSPTVSYTSSITVSSSGNGVDTFKVCPGSSITLTGSGANTHAWSGPQSIANGVAFAINSSGLYTMTGTAVNTCTATKLVYVSLLPVLTTNYMSNPSVTSTGGGVDTIKTCSGLNVILTGIGSYTHSWSGPQPIYDNTAFSAVYSGLYTLTSSLVGSCSGSKSVFISLSSSPSLTISNSTGTFSTGTHVSTYAGSGASGSLGSASMSGPSGLNFDRNKDLYIADFYNNRVVRISASGVYSVFAGTGTSGGNNGAIASSTFAWPLDVLADTAGNIYVLEYAGNRLRKITTGGVVSTLAGSGSGGFANGTGTAASFSSPTGMCIDNQGNIYIADRGNNRIRMVTSAGVVTTVAGSGTYASTDGTGTAASFQGPNSICRDPAGNLYVTDEYSNKIRKITPSGVVTTIAGTGSSGSTDGAAASATFSQPSGVKMDVYGNLIIVEQGNRIRRLSPNGIVSTISGTGTSGVTNGALSTSTFTQPWGVAIDSVGNIFIADRGSSRIRKISYNVDTVKVCLGLNQTFTASGANSFSWSGPQTVTNAVPFTANSFGVYTVSGIGSNGCPSAKSIQLQTNNVTPILSTSGLNTTKFTRRTTCGSNLVYGDGINFYFFIDTSGITSGSLTGDTVSVYVKTTIDSFKSTNGANQEHAMFLLPRYWNAKGNFTGTVKVRFPYNPADTLLIMTLRDSALSRLIRTQPNTKAAKTPYLEWFKTVGVPYNESYIATIVGNRFPTTIMKPTVTYGIANGVHFVELGGITSFSGGGAGFGFGPGGGGGGGVGLPVTWAGFDVHVTESGNQLYWQTASEQNTDYFEVEYSYDGKAFESLPEKIPAAGNSAVLKNYQYSHLEYSTYVYYRVKQVDLDGLYTYSSIKLAKRTKENGFQVSVLPTQIPQNGIITLTAKFIDQSQLFVQVFDLTGKTVFGSAYSPAKDILEENIELSKLQTGVYFMEVSNGQGKERVKIVK